MLLSLDPRLFEAVLDAVSCGVLTTDPKMRITSFNRAAEVITGWKSGEVVGRSCHEVMQFTPREEACPEPEKLRSGELFGPKVLHIRTRDGRMVPVRLTAQMLRDRKGRVIGVVQSFGDLSTVQALRRKLEGRYVFYDIISQDHEMQDLFEILPRIADTRGTVLIRGESGTGKELFARAIHHLSPFREGPFVAVNCAALPDTLLEAELFGYVKGAFSDARTDREGRIAAAEGGTLLLDEVGDISPAMQVKLLRFLQDHQYEPLGTNRTIKANVRVIAATNKSLDDMVQRGEFREDFFYRLNVLSIDIPPLRRRLGDVPLLAEHFLETWSRVNDKPTGALTPDALRALMRYEYPGNVRELENIIERAAVMAAGEEIDLSHLPAPLQALGAPGAARAAGSGMSSTSRAGSATERAFGRERGLPHTPSLTPVETAEREAIREALRRSGGNRQEAAHLLGMSRATLWRKRRKYHLD